eukprot:9891148-Alexandrium_andersonii.AAC.1
MPGHAAESPTMATVDQVRCRKSPRCRQARNQQEACRGTGRSRALESQSSPMFNIVFVLGSSVV